MRLVKKEYGVKKVNKRCFIRNCPKGGDNSPIRSRDSRNLRKPSCSCETSFNVGGKTLNIVFQLILWPCFETSCMFLLLVLRYIK